jgi:hypothetical protein
MASAPPIEQLLAWNSALIKWVTQPVGRWMENTARSALTNSIRRRKLMMLPRRSAIGSFSLLLKCKGHVHVEEKLVAGNLSCWITYCKSEAKSFRGASERTFWRHVEGINTIYTFICRCFKNWYLTNWKHLEKKSVIIFFLLSLEFYVTGVFYKIISKMKLAFKHSNLSESAPCLNQF